MLLMQHFQSGPPCLIQPVSVNGSLTVSFYIQPTSKSVGLSLKIHPEFQNFLGASLHHCSSIVMTPNQSHGFYTTVQQPEWFVDSTSEICPFLKFQVFTWPFNILKHLLMCTHLPKEKLNGLQIPSLTLYVTYPQSFIPSGTPSG